MGLDGGTIITRSDVLRGQSWELSQADTSRSTRGGSIGASHVHKKRKLDVRTEKVTRWTNCSLSDEPLAPPIVSDFLGRLYNKAAVLEFLLARSGAFQEEAQVHKYINQLREAGGAFDHITSTKDVFEVHMAPAAGRGPTPPVTDAQAAALYRCPITDLPCDCYPFSALATCGHVFSDRAIKEIPGGVCSLCDKPFTASDVIPICGTPEQVEQLKEALPQRKNGKKRKKARKQEGDTQAGSGVQAPAAL